MPSVNISIVGNPKVNISIMGNPKDALILEYAFKTDNIADRLIGADYARANEILLEYGATITKWNRNCDDGQDDELQVTALSDADFHEALDKAEEYKSWMVATFGSDRLSHDEIVEWNKKEPCPVTLDTISRNIMRLDPSTFRASLHRIFDTDEYKLQLWDWMHLDIYAPLFVGEQCPNLDSIPHDMVYRYFSLP